MFGPLCGPGLRFPVKFSNNSNHIKKSIIFHDRTSLPEKIIYFKDFNEWRIYMEQSTMILCLKAIYFH